MGSSGSRSPVRVLAAETGAAMSSEGSPGEDPLPHSLTWLLAGSSSSRTHGPHHRAVTRGSLLPPARVTQEIALIGHIQDRSLSPFRCKSQSCPNPQGGDHTGEWIPRCGLTRGHSRRCLQQICVSHIVCQEIPPMKVNLSCVVVTCSCKSTSRGLPPWRIVGKAQSRALAGKGEPVAVLQGPAGMSTTSGREALVTSLTRSQEPGQKDTLRQGQRAEIRPWSWGQRQRLKQDEDKQAGGSERGLTAQWVGSWEVLGGCCKPKCPQAKAGDVSQ